MGRRPHSGQQAHERGDASSRMRLTCPNCKAQYEVADSVIPPDGRDVQCSACGTTWFQYPVEVALRMRVAELEADDDPDAPGPARPAPAPVPAEQRIDKTVLEVLRQEAERELRERRQARPPVETQGELGLVGRPRRRAAEPTAEVAVPPTRPAAEGSRRSLLPDIESISPEIESTGAKRAASPPPPAAEPAAAEDPGRGFRRGLAYVVVAGAVLVALYLMAPTLAALVPAIEGPLAGYVTAVEALRALLAGLLGS